MVGHLPGGLAQVNVVTNLIFSGMSGSAVADASGPGLIVARMMTKDRAAIRAGFAAATSVVSATLGPLMPTSIPMIFYALIANASVGAMFLGGLVPAGLMALSLMIVIAVIARRRDFPREARTSWSQMPAIFGRALLPIALPGILLGLIYSGVTTPTEAAAIAASYALLLALVVYRTLAPGAAADGDLRHGARHGNDRADHVGRLRVQLRGGQRGRAAAHSDTFAAWNLSPIGISALRRRADAAARHRARRGDDPAGDRAAPGADRAGLGIDLVHFGIVVVLNMMVGLTLPPHGLLLFVMSGLTRHAACRDFSRGAALHRRHAGDRDCGDVVPEIALWLPRAAGLLK